MHTESNTSVSKEPHPCGSPNPDELADLLQAMEELDAPENTPKCLSPAVWERFCAFRRTKVESEHKVMRVVANVSHVQLWVLCVSVSTHTLTFSGEGKWKNICQDAGRAAEEKRQAGDCRAGNQKSL